MLHPNDRAIVAAPTAPLAEVVGSEKTVPILDGSYRRYVNLDNAASTPALREVQSKVDEFLTWYSSVHRGSGFKSLLSSRAYDTARGTVGAFLGADPESDCVIFGKNTSEAINLLANTLQLSANDVVISTQMEHHSNDLPWRKVAQVAHARALPDGTLDFDDLTAKLAQYAGRVRLLAVTGASNVTGFVNPVHDLAELAHQYGARILVDCAQLAPHRPIDMGPVGSPRHLDFVAISGHKLYAPFGTGALIGPKAFFKAAPPDYRGGGTVEIVTLEDVHWADPPERDEAGSPNVVGAVALAVSIRVLSRIGMSAVAAHEAELTSYALRKLAGVPGIKIYGSGDPERTGDRLGVISFAVEGIPHAKVAAILGFEGAIGVRNGCFCAHPYILHLLGVRGEAYQLYQRQVLAHDRSAIPGLVRASFGCYTTAEDVDTLVDMLGRISSGRYQGDYYVDRASGSYYPRGFDPALLDQFFQL